MTEKIVYISNDKEENQDQWLSVMYRDYAKIKLVSNYEGRSIILGLPKAESMIMDTYPITIYQYNEQAVYENNYLHGWAAPNPLGYRWMNAKDAYLECFLRKENYQMILHCGDVIPFDLIKAEKISVDIYLNDTFVWTVDWTGQNADQDKVVDIPLSLEQ